VIEKLEGLGWGFEIQKLPIDDDLGGHKLVKQPTRLTERSLYFLYLPLLGHTYSHSP
jgi:hypothetical protein